MIERWARERPFLVAVIVLLAVVLPGLLRVENIANKADDAADAAQAVADKNKVVVSCVTAWAIDLTDALQDRDAVIQTARAAEREAWATFRRLIRDTTPDPDARDVMIASISRYLAILARLDSTTSINPYPDLSDCLTAEEIAEALEHVGKDDLHESPLARAPYRLVRAVSALHPNRVKCAGHLTTIRGSSGDDNIRGTDGDDVIRTFRGDDLVLGGRGNDLICGGRGDDTINGGKGHDHARGQAGSDFCIQTEHDRSC